MQVGCTRKLLDYIGVKGTPADTALAPELRWSANIVMVNRRRAVAIVHDSSRYGFVLYGIRNKDIAGLGELILDGIRACMEAECIDGELVEKYLAECGAVVHYTKTAGSTAVARLNKFCERVIMFSKEYSTEHILQNQVMLKLNCDFITLKDDLKRDYVSVHEKLGEDFSQRYDVHPYKCRAAEFEVELELERPCRRHIIVPLGFTFRQFHHVLQGLFCWQDYHLHDFFIERYPDGQLKYSLVGFPRDYVKENETTTPDNLVHLFDIFPQYSHIVYNYDFGDNWTHHIRLKGIIDDYDKNHAVCLSGEGDAPPEDSGGPPGYEELLRVLADPEDPEHEHITSWFGMMNCKPFDLDAVNLRIKYCLRLKKHW